MISKKIMTLLKTSMIAVACTAILVPANATTVYKYVGDFGEVKYSQFPPTDGRDVEVIELRSNRQSTAGQYAGKTTTETPQATEAEDVAKSEEEQRIAELEAQVEQQEAQQKAERCARLSNSLDNLNTGGRLYIPDGDGGKKYLDDREAELERERVQNLLNSYCQG